MRPPIVLGIYCKSLNLEAAPETPRALESNVGSNDLGERRQNMMFQHGSSSNDLPRKQVLILSAEIFTPSTFASATTSWHSLRLRSRDQKSILPYVLRLGRNHPFAISAT